MSYMKRSLARELAFKALFQLDFNSGDDNDKELYEDAAIDGVINGIISDEDIINSNRILKEEERIYINQVVKGTREKLEEIDGMISAHLKKGWVIERLATVDRNILRLSVYEMKFAKEKIPIGIIINEAVEIAKWYGTESSSRFVNGLLAAIEK